jgi:hypothetical protein
MYAPQDQLMTAHQLAQVPTPAAIGRFHQPVSFGQYTDLIRHRLERADIDILEEEYCLTPDGQTFFGTMLLERVSGFDQSGVQITLGVRGSHVQKIPRGICLGTRVIVCSNLMFNGDLANISTKQTLNIWQRLPALVDQAINRLPAMAAREQRRVTAYKGFDIKPRHGDAALVELHRQGALSGSQLAHAIAEWDAPSFAEHAADGHNAWRLLQACTQAVKPAGDRVNMDTIRARTAIASSWLDSVVSVQ